MILFFYNQINLTQIEHSFPMRQDYILYMQS